MLEKLFPSLKASEEARAINEQVAQAKDKHTYTTQVFAASLDRLLNDYTRVRHELAVLKSEKRSQRFR